MAKVLIACGGTGGHFYPGLALGQALKARGHEPVFLLRKGDPAFETLEALGLPSAEADVLGLPRKLLADWPSWAWRTLGGFRTVRNIVGSWRPNLVVGMGAYLTLPAAFFAWRRGIPVLLHESNAKLGLANRLARPLASTLALGLPCQEAPGAVLTGTPIRDMFRRLPEPAQARRELGLEPDKPTVLVFGGSQGALKLNRLAIGALRQLDRRRPGSLQTLLLAGKKNGEPIRAEAAGLPIQVRDYLERMYLAFAAANLVVCRSGASTVAELIASRRPAILVPFPFATGRHQSANAAAVEKAGAALLIEEENLTEGGLANSLEAVILSEPGRLGAMAEAYHGLPDPFRAVDSLVACAEQLVPGERHAQRIA